MCIRRKIVFLFSILSSLAKNLLGAYLTLSDCIWPPRVTAFSLLFLLFYSILCFFNDTRLRDIFWSGPRLRKVDVMPSYRDKISDDKFLMSLMIVPEDEDDGGSCFAFQEQDHVKVGRAASQQGLFPSSYVVRIRV